MKKIFIVAVTLVFILTPQFALAVLCETREVEIVKNELPCIKTSSDCFDGAGVGFLNECKQEVVYTDLNCANSTNDNIGSVRVINKHEASLSRETYSNLAISEDSKYFGRVNYSGGAWLDCKADKSFYDIDKKQITVKFRMGDKKYEIIAHLPYAPDKVNQFQYGKIVFPTVLALFGISIIFLIAKPIGTRLTKEERKNLMKKINRRFWKKFAVFVGISIILIAIFCVWLYFYSIR